MERFAPLFIFIAIFVFRALTKAVNAAKEKQAEAPATDEQTRRVQEEIRRKIAERRGVPPARPATQPTTRPLPPPVAAPRPVYDSGGDILRKRLAERLRAREQVDSKRLADAILADDAGKAATARAIAMPAAPLAPSRPKTYLGVPVAGARPVSVTGLMEDLRDPDKVRRAFVLREILSPPVALR